jgi:hypothetical protein
VALRDIIDVVFEDFRLPDGKVLTPGKLRAMAEGTRRPPTTKG